MIHQVILMMENNQETMIQVNQTLETIQGIMTQASKMMEEINQETVVIINNHLNMMGILVRIKVIIIQILDQMDQIMVRKIIPIAIQIIIVIILAIIQDTQVPMIQ